VKNKERIDIRRKEYLKINIVDKFSPKRIKNNEPKKGNRGV